MDAAASRTQFDYMSLYESAWHARSITHPSPIPTDSLPPSNSTMTQNKEEHDTSTPPIDNPFTIATTATTTPSESGSSYFPYTAPSLASTQPCPDDFGYTFSEHLRDESAETWRRLPADHPEKIGTIGLRTVCSVELFGRSRREKRKECWVLRGLRRVWGKVRERREEKKEKKGEEEEEKAKWEGKGCRML